MKKHREKTKYKAGEWSEISAFLSGEKLKNSSLSDRFMAEDNNTAKRWKDISDMDIKEINVDRARKNYIPDWTITNSNLRHSVKEYDQTANNF